MDNEKTHVDTDLDLFQMTLAALGVEAVWANVS